MDSPMEKGRKLCFRYSMLDHVIVTAGVLNSTRYNCQKICFKNLPYK